MTWKSYQFPFLLTKNLKEVNLKSVRLRPCFSSLTVPYKVEPTKKDKTNKFLLLNSHKGYWLKRWQVMDWLLQRIDWPNYSVWLNGSERFVHTVFLITWPTWVIWHYRSWDNFNVQTFREFSIRFGLWKHFCINIVSKNIMFRFRLILFLRNQTNTNTPAWFDCLAVMNWDKLNLHD